MQRSTVAVVVAVLGWNAVCVAQPQSGAVALEEIIVSARRTTETLQNAPIAVNAFTSDMIEQLGISSPENVMAQIPNILMIGGVVEAGESQVVIRGINNPRDFDPPYALIVDGVQQPDPFALSGRLVDIESIEVVKGPVSALYGRNALGGAILINSKPPPEQFEAMVRLGVANGDRREVTGSVGGPIGSPKVRGRVSAFHTDQDGVQKNYFLGDHVDYHKESRAQGRIVWSPADTISVDITGEWVEFESNAIPFIGQFPFFPAIQPQFTSGINVNDTSVLLAPNVKTINPGERLNGVFKLSWDVGVGSLMLAAGYNKNENEFGSDYILQLINEPPFAIFEGLSLTNPGEANNSLNSIGYSPFPGTIAYQARDGEATTAEIRWSSAQNQKVRWAIGGYFAEIERDVFVSVERDDFNGVVQRVHPNASTVNITEDMLTETDVTAFYGQVFYDITDALELTVAGRWDEEERRSTNNLDPAYAALPSLAQYTGLVREETFDKFQPRVSLRWIINPRHTLYTAYGEGFRAGGFNAPGTREVVLTVDGLPPEVNIFDTFKEELVSSIEMGWRGTFADSVRVSVAVFDSQSENTQFFEFTPVSATRARTNIDETESRGVELESTWRTPLNGLDVSLAYGYTRSKITKQAGNPNAIGNPVPTVPKDTLNFGVQYVRPAFGDALLRTRFDLQRIGDTSFDINGAPKTVRDPVHLLGGRIGLEQGRWAVVAWASNLTDERYLIDNVIVTLPGEYPFNKINLAPYGEPRRYGLDVTVRF